MNERGPSPHLLTRAGGGGEEEGDGGDTGLAASKAAPSRLCSLITALTSSLCPSRPLLQGKYVEAEIAKNRLEELKLHEENRRKEAMRSRQLAERLGVEEAHMLEYQQFNMDWDRKMGEYETHASQLVEAMRDRHKSELKDFQQNLLQKQQRPKFSRELLNLRRIQEHLAKQKE